MTSQELVGLSILVTRPKRQSEPLAQSIRALGGNALIWPLMEIEALKRPRDESTIAANQQKFKSLGRYDAIIFVSANAARSALTLFDNVDSSTLGEQSVCCFAIGMASAEVIRASGLKVTSAGGAMDSEALLLRPELQQVAGQRLLICRGEGGRTMLAETLRARGAKVDEAPLYRRVCPAYAEGSLAKALRTHEIDTIQLGSGETLKNLLSVLGDQGSAELAATIQLVVPGTRVARLAWDAGFEQVCCTVEPTDSGIIAALQDLARPGVRIQTELE